MQKEVIFNMHTGDPDDFFALVFLLGHPEISLKAVTIYPGTPLQIGLVSKAIKWFKEDCKIGAYDISYAKDLPIDWFEFNYGKITASRDSYNASQLLVELSDDDTVLISGGPLQAISRAIYEAKKDNKRLRFRECIIHAGFAGKNMVADNLLPQPYQGKETTPSFNFDSDRKAAWKVIRSRISPVKRFVSKNVSQHIQYDKTLHDFVRDYRQHNLAIALIWKAMEKHLKKGGEPKKFNDVFTACCAINPEIGEWKEVEFYRKSNGWGSREKEGSGAWVMVDYNRELFLETLSKHN